MSGHILWFVTTVMFLRVFEFRFSFFKESVVLRWLPVFFYITNRTKDESLKTDLNHDGKINILDISIVARAFETKPRDELWNGVADLDKSGAIDIIDIAIVARDYGETT